MLRTGLLLGLLLAAGCEDESDVDATWLRSGKWDDGAAVVSVFEGRWMRYGSWRDALVRDYVIREYLHPEELTKRDEVTDGLVPVIKANRQVTFTTGTYQYRLMHSLFFDRRDGSLVKAVGTSQEGCGIVFQRWDRKSGRLSFDSYWEGEGAGSRELPGGRFEDEIPFLGASLRDGDRLTVFPSLMRNRLHGASAEERTVRREGRRTILSDAVFEYDADGFLVAWTIPGRQEFRRTVKRRLYYWQHHDPGDEKLLEAE